MGTASPFPRKPPRWGLALARGTITGTGIQRSARSGVSVFGADLGIGATIIDCNTIDLDGEMLERAPFTVTELLPIACGCGEDVGPCKVLSASLEAPSAL